MNTTVQSLVALFLVAALGSEPAVAQSPADSAAPRTVSVQGEGSVTAPPDRAIVRFGVVSQAATAEEARAQNATASRRAMNAVRELGIPEERLRMEQLQLEPRREYNPDTRNYEEKGYEATRQVVVELDSLDRLPSLIARVVQEGANRLQGVEYDLKNRTAVRNDALIAAATSAREKAQLLAETLGATLGPVQQINEQTVDVPRPMMRAEAMAMKAQSDRAAPEPEAYAAGELEVTASVQVTFRLE